MESKGDISEFNAFVAKCAGSDEKEVQASYLVRILKEMVAKCSRQGSKLSDDNVLKAIGVTSVESIFAVMEKPGDIYSVVRKSLLENPSLDWDVVRLKVKTHIQER